MLIKQYENGILVPCNDEKSLEKAITYMITEENERIKLGHQAKQSAKNFNTAIVMEKWYSYLFLER